MHERLGKCSPKEAGFMSHPLSMCTGSKISVFIPTILGCEESPMTLVSLQLFAHAARKNPTLLYRHAFLRRSCSATLTNICISTIIEGYWREIGWHNLRGVLGNAAKTEIYLLKIVPPNCPVVFRLIVFNHNQDKA